jgi:hypothetical protein
MTFWTVILFAVLEPLRHVVEPLVLRAKRRSVSGRGGHRRVILDLAVGPLGPVALDPAHALFGRLCQARRTSSVHRRDAGRPAGADTSTDRIPTHVDGRSA